MKKKNLLAVGALLCVMALLAAVYLLSRPQTTAGEKEISVEVVHSDGETKEFSYRTDAEYLGDVLQAEGLIEGEKSAYGLYIKVVDGERADYELDGVFWAFYEGGESAAQGVDQTPVTDGGAYRLVYTYG